MNFGDLGYLPSAYGNHLPGYRGTSLQLLSSIFPDERACLRHLFLFRTGGKRRCSRCGVLTAAWAYKEPFKYYYHACGGIYSPMVGTIFQSSRVEIQLWFYLMMQFCNSAQSLSTEFIARQIGVSVPTALRMSRHIRFQMAILEAEKKIGGPEKEVVVQLHTLRRVTNYRKGSPNRCTVLFLSDGDRVEAIVVPYADRPRMQLAFRQCVVPGSILVTDCHQTIAVATNYNLQNTEVTWASPSSTYNLAGKRAIHGFLAVFHQALRDQFRSVLRENLWLYLKEFQYRFNHRENSRMAFWNLVCDWPNLSGDWQKELERRSHLRQIRDR